MNKVTKRAGLVAVVGAAAAVAAFATHADAKSYSNRDFQGQYGVEEWGYVQGAHWTEVAVIDADGQGNAVIEFAGNIGSQTLLRDTIVCPYEVRANGLGSMHCPEGVEVEFVLVDRGNELRFMTLPGPHGVQAIGNGRRM